MLHRHLALGPLQLHFLGPCLISPPLPAHKRYLSLFKEPYAFAILASPWTFAPWHSLRRCPRWNWSELSWIWDWGLEAIIERILLEEKRQALIYLYGKLSWAWYSTDGSVFLWVWGQSERKRTKQVALELAPFANISSGHTQSPSPCARTSEASAEPEGWCYFDHCTPFSEYTWLIPLLPLMDPILNGKSLLERQIPTTIMYTMPFSQHPTAPLLATPILEAFSFWGTEFYWGRIRSHREMKLLAPSSKVNLVLREHPSCPLCMFFGLAFENSSSLPIEKQN